MDKQLSEILERYSDELLNEVNVLSLKSSLERAGYTVSRVYAASGDDALLIQDNLVHHF